jgi:hypothetical protein
MTQEKYDQLWDNLILTAINNYISQNSFYELAIDKNILKRDIRNMYENEYKPQFKYNCMGDDSEAVDNVLLGGGKALKIDRHKVAALLYLSIVCNDNMPFVRLKNKQDPNSIFSILACHKIAYSISLNCIHSFIQESYKSDPNCRHKSKFLSNGGFSKSPDLLCEKYSCYKDSIIPRMVWATETNINRLGKLVPANANMLANIFYFLELYAASTI